MAQTSLALAQDLQELLFKLGTVNIYRLPSSHHIKRHFASPPPNTLRLIEALTAKKEGEETDVGCVKLIQRVIVLTVLSGSATQCLDRQEHDITN